MPPKQYETNTFSLETVPNDTQPVQDVGPRTSVFAAAGSRAESRTRQRFSSATNPWEQGMSNFAVTPVLNQPVYTAFLPDVLSEQLLTSTNIQANVLGLSNVSSPTQGQTLHENMDVEMGYGGNSVAATPTRNRLRVIADTGSEPSWTEPVPYTDFGLGADSSRLRGKD